MGHVVDLLLIALWLLLEPLLLGRAVGGALNLYRGRKIESILFYYVAGYITNWAVFQIWAVPLILMRKSLTMLTLCWGFSILAVIVICLFISHRRKEAWVEIEYQTDNKLWFVIMTVAALVLILWQCSKYVFMMHLDEDDATFLADATSAYQTGLLYRHHWATGDLLRDDIIALRHRDITSPWPMFLAMLGKLTKIHPTIIAHTILPVFLLSLMYATYYLIGNQLFQHKRNKSILFCYVVAFCFLFFSGSKRTSAEFALFRIWQGKAVVAAFIIPLILYWMLHLFYEKDAKRRQAVIILILISGFAACALSGMGVVLFGFTTIIYGIAYIITTKRWKEIVPILGTLFPAVLYFILQMALI